MLNLQPQAAGLGRRVLLTNAFIRNYSGSELYVRDVALALRQRGHLPIIYSPRLGTLAEDLRQAGILVTDDLADVGPPDLIHGQHHCECMTALARYPGVPAVYFCHGPSHWATPPVHPRLLHYVVVSEYGRQRLLAEHQIPADRLSVLHNFVNLDQFEVRPPLPPRPQKALVFSNQATVDNFAGVVRAACAQQDIAVDIVGLANGNPCSRPGTLLRNYDLIFARGRAALESLAVGASVICCDGEGLGPMVTSENQARLRSRNLGIALLTQPFTVEALLAEIQRYDPVDARRVSVSVRADASLETAVDHILTTYNHVLADWAKAGAAKPDAEAKAMAAYLKWSSLTASGPAIAELHASQAQLRRAQAAHHKLQEEWTSLQQTLMWQIYRRLTGFGPLRAVYTVLAHPFKAWGNRRRAQSS